MISEYTREILKMALGEGGRVLLQHFGTVMEAREKESISSVVTDADHASEKKILEVLNDAKNPYNIISEEAGYTNRNSEFTWVVDPLDGTSNFAAGLTWFGIIITLFRENEPVLAGMFLPVENQLYLAEKGKGASKNKQPIRTSRSARAETQLVSYSFDYNPDPEKTKAEMQLMATLSRHVRNLRSTNSLCDFCYVADGRLGAAINQTTRIWDIAAPSLIISEAGGVVTDLSGQEIEYDLDLGNSLMDRNYTILASGRLLHPTLIHLCSIQ
jgi:myo-inositol-1(or 4)-monophosphatase